MPHQDGDGALIRHIVSPQSVLDHGIVSKAFTGFDCGTPLFEQTVTSRHHQAVDEVADGFAVALRAEDGVIEAIEFQSPDWTAVGIQFHPEAPEATEIERGIFAAWVEAVGCVQRESHELVA